MTTAADILAAIALLTERIVSIDTTLASILSTINNTKVEKDPAPTNADKQVNSRAVEARRNFYYILKDNYGIGKEFLLRDARAVGGRVRNLTLDARGRPIAEATMGYFFSDLCNAKLVERVRNGAFRVLPYSDEKFELMKKNVDGQTLLKAQKKNQDLLV